MRKLVSSFTPETRRTSRKRCYILRNPPNRSRTDGKKWQGIYPLNFNRSVISEKLNEVLESTLIEIHDREIQGLTVILLTDIIRDNLAE